MELSKATRVTRKAYVVAMATERCNKNAKLNVFEQYMYSLLYIVKHIAICQVLIAKKTKVATKLMKIVLF
jgi:hypothetical protein